MREAKQLWARHKCATRYARPFNMRVDSFANLAKSHVLCEDWSRWTDPVIWFADATDAVGLQWFLKSLSGTMRMAAAQLLGQIWDPSSRPNTFGELGRALVGPSPAITQAVEWALEGKGDPDFVVHLRHGRKSQTSTAVSACILAAIRRSTLSIAQPGKKKRKPIVAIITDTPSAVHLITKHLGKKAQVVSFEYERYIRDHPSDKVLSASSFQAPEKRKDDWGPLPRWVALVDFFLATRARVAFISGGGSRVATTFAQLAASFSAAEQLGKPSQNKDGSGFTVYSSFQKVLVTNGLFRQSGRGYSWHTFSGELSCPAQGRQCAKTPLLPYAWWEAPWQSIAARDERKLNHIGLRVGLRGEVTREAVTKFCRERKRVKPFRMELALPFCDEEGLCREREGNGDKLRVNVRVVNNSLEARTKPDA
eukprot:TRINITY_DN10823_c0_g1_i2.p1 TRINITY_DN10823_c0_g1~~TRINITY_DN10823_c0_g1_i2.p1  ORF type:complete len:423 (+),score=44.70 TRINITY_DN10823_c0_g1_i2:820-2088(+)